MGNWVLMGMHAAYYDEQICQINVSQTAEGRIEISYADGETHCTGVVNSALNTISGSVKQLLMGEEGFYVPSAQVSHTFELSLKDELPAKRQLRMQLNHGRQRRIRALASVLSLVIENKETEMLKDELASLRDLPLQQLLDDAMLWVERVCAHMRRQASLMQTLTFQSSEDRSDCLASLAQQGACFVRACPCVCVCVCVCVCCFACVFAPRCRLSRLKTRTTTMIPTMIMMITKARRLKTIIPHL